LRKESRCDFVFDFGGVVIKWRNNHPIYDYIADRYGVPRLELRAVLEAALPDLESNQVGVSEMLEGSLARFGKTLRAGDDPNELWAWPFARLAKLRVGTVEVVKSLRRRGYRAFLFSNTSFPHAQFVRKVGWDRFFDDFVGSCELGCVKPAPEAFEAALQRFGVSPGNAAYIDDREENVRGAKRYGIRWALRFTSVARLREDIAPLLASD